MRSAADRQLSAPEVLTAEEEVFCRAFSQTRNAMLSYQRAFPKFKDPRIPRIEGPQLLRRPHISARILELEEAQDAPYVFTLGEHLIKLAEIRDASIGAKQMKVALEAEIVRGRLIGFYRNMDSDGDRGGPMSAININIGGADDEMRAKAVFELMGKNQRIIEHDQDK